MLTPRLLVLCLVLVHSAAAQGSAPFENGGRPTVSPDGRLIAFTSERGGKPQIYLMNPDGSGVRQLTNETDRIGRPYWSTDGQRILYSIGKNDTATVYSIPVAGGPATRLGRVAARGGPAPIAGGRRVVFGVGSWTEMQLVAADLDGSNRTELTHDRAAYWCHSVSRSGQRLAVGRRDSNGMQIWIMRLDGSGAEAVTRFSRADGDPQCPDWSSDESRIAAQSASPLPGDSTKFAAHIWVIDLSTRHATRLAEHSAPYQDELPAWFPDGKRIAFQSDRTGRWEVWVMNADGTGAHQLTH